MEMVTQDPRDCVFAHFYGEDALGQFDPGKLTVVAQEEKRFGPLTFKVAIIGESDFVVVGHDRYGVLFIELLACVNPNNLGFRPKSTRPFSHGVRHHSVQHTKGALAAFFANATIQPPTRDTGFYCPPKDGSFIHLEHAFPGELSPKTVVGVYIKTVGGLKVGVEIMSLHEYAIEGQIVPLISCTQLFRLPITTHRKDGWEIAQPAPTDADARLPAML